MTAILAALAACCGQREGTGLENSCALDIGPSPKIHTPRPAVKPWHRLRRLRES